MTPEPSPAHAPFAQRRLRQAALVLVGIALFSAFAALGTWQVQRRAWKLALMERVEHRVHAAPVAAPPASQWPRVNAADHEYLAVTLQGRWLADKTVLTQAVTELGAGFWVMAPLQLDDGTQVLVNRGFVPQAQRNQWLTGGAQPPRPVATVEGLLRISEPGGGFLRTNDPAQQRWHSRDVAAISQALGLPRAAPFFVDAGLPAAGGAPSVQTWPRPGMTVIRFSNSHLVYAATWYGLALMVAGAGWYVARYERRRHGPSRRPTTTDEPPSP
ncbi:SURF1 family protein [Acidovorax sp. A79]|uniref:SURF1 family protein n=1 Tax=unclassified Acidovorax TaxID=2684926 RepID=UPI001C48C14B|nr:MULTISPECIES: SURF1 family protein [unclassified Acidovorax]MBV7429021.1 SURF1 family protein [Acidovorax sp. sif0732]MBV7450847.1 SURF1 family protein [Acidovorax sp. sif0715]